MTTAVLGKAKAPSRTVAAGLLAAGLAGGVGLAAAEPAEAVIIKAAKNSDFWYSALIVNNRVYTAGNIRYSWSWMWYLNGKEDYVTAFTTAACAFIPNKGASVACATLVGTYMTYMKSMMNKGLATKQCLQFRFAMPPLPALQSFQVKLVKCVR